MNYLIERNYIAHDSDELSLSIGDIANNVKLFGEGWMDGCINGKRGIFPSNFGKEIKVEKNGFRESPSDSYKNDKRTNEEVLQDSGIEVQTLQARKVVGVGFGNIFNGKQIQLKHASPTANNNTTVKPIRPLPITKKPKSSNPGDVVSPHTPNINNGSEWEDIYFDSPVPHRPLVLPTAERARRQNIRCSNKMNNMDGVRVNTDIVSPRRSSGETLTKVISRGDPVQKSIPPPILPLKPNINKPKVSSSSLSNNNPFKPILENDLKGYDITGINVIDVGTPRYHNPFRDTTSSDSNNKCVAKDPSKRISHAGLMKENNIEIPPREISSTKDGIETLFGFQSIKILKSNSRTKSQLNIPKENSLHLSKELSSTELNYPRKPQSFSEEALDNKISVQFFDQNDIIKKIDALQAKVLAIEEENNLWKKELTEVLKTNSSAYDHLIDPVKKLLQYFAEQKPTESKQ